MKGKHKYLCTVCGWRGNGRQVLKLYRCPKCGHFCAVERDMTVEAMHKVRELTILREALKAVFGDKAGSLMSDKIKEMEGRLDDVEFKNLILMSKR
jgi:hypothetical protein